MAEMKLSKLADTLISSEIVRLGGIVREKIAAGEKIYNFTIGDFDSQIFPIPGVLQEEIIRAYQEGFTTYPAADGEFVLRSAIAHFIERKQGLAYSPNEILVSCGGRPLIYAIYRAIVDKGDKVIYPVPSWNNNHYTHFTEGEHVQVLAGRETNFMPTASQIEPHLHGATLLALCSPLNPTGTVFNPEELGAICDLVLKENARRDPGQKKLYVLYDQIYWTLCFGDVRHCDPVTLRPAMRDYTVFVDGISKAFSATGVRVGWSMGPETILSKMKAINSHVGSWAPMAEQVATARFLRRDKEVDDFLEQFREAISLRLFRLYNGFRQLKVEGFPVDAVVPQAAIYLTVKLDLKGAETKAGKRLEKQEDVTDYILNEAKIALVPFGFFGADRESCWYRISVGCSVVDDLDHVLQQLRQSLESLRK
jgi:aspartate aminotransferase